MTKNEILRDFYATQVGSNAGTLQDLEGDFVRQETGASGPNPQLLQKFLRDSGYTGTISQMIARWEADGFPVPNPNLLAGLSWVAGANTTLSIANGLARATRNGANPRIYKHVTGLSIGTTYRMIGNGYKRTCTNIVLRAATDSTISNGDNYDSGLLPNDTAFNVTFVASRTFEFIGFIGTSTVNGQFCEIDEDFILEPA